MTKAQDLKKLEKSIIINASAQKVWSVLTDFGNWENGIHLSLKAREKQR